MQSRTPVFIVTSSRPRVGKTLIARALIEYFCAQDRPVAGFDVNPGEFNLIDHLPAYTAAASIDDTRDEMALFDQIVADDGVAKVVDLGHMLFERFFAVVQQIDFIAETGRGTVAPMVLFIADADDRARQGYAVLRSRFPELPLVPVFNEGIPQAIRDHTHFLASPRGGLPLHIPALSPVVRSVVERTNFSFLTYARKTDDKTSELFSWMRQVFADFRDLEVRLLLDEIAPRLKHSA
jgi:hypothetical protein